MVNWYEIDTSTNDGQRQLDRVIAKRDGYEWMIGETDAVFMYGTEIIAQYNTPETPAAFFEDLIFGLIPHYSTNAEIALDLITTYDGEYTLMLELRWNGVDWQAQLYPAPAVLAYGITPALAICKAWLAYTDAEHE